MKLTRKQIEAMAAAVELKNGTDTFYVEEGRDGRITFGSVTVKETRKGIALGKVEA